MSMVYDFGLADPGVHWHPAPLDLTNGHLPCRQIYPGFPLATEIVAVVTAKPRVFLVQ